MEENCGESDAVPRARRAYQFAVRIFANCPVLAPARAQAMAFAISLQKRHGYRDGVYAIRMKFMRHVRPPRRVGYVPLLRCLVSEVAYHVDQNFCLPFAYR